MLGPERMDARTAESPISSRRQSWLQRERASGRFYDRVSVVLVLFLFGMIGLSAWLLTREAEPGTILKPPVIALLLVAILLPAISLMALYARKLAVRRAEQGGLGGGRGVRVFLDHARIGRQDAHELAVDLGVAADQLALVQDRFGSAFSL